jgi:septal ring factor EnvC (AmiA/AmiB activator)
VWRASLVLLAAVAHADPRDVIDRQLADESATIDSASTIVADKIATLDLERTKRLGAAYSALRPVASSDSMTLARRRAAARMLVGRDLEERRLLADELAELRTARTRVTNDVARAATLTPPADLARPAKGTIARKFGTLQHERSKAVLSRRGIDIDVEAKAQVLATADGIVRYVGPIRGLDKGVVIDHGAYLTVLAKLGEIRAPVGVAVKRGEIIGRAARQRVYVEVRIKIGSSGLPIDPEPLFAR